MRWIFAVLAGAALVTADALAAAAQSAGWEDKQRRTM
jgi:hypothetical protein